MDMEAELSEDEEGVAAASEDEDERGGDDGELVRAWLGCTRACVRGACVVETLGCERKERGVR